MTHNCWALSTTKRSQGNRYSQGCLAYILMLGNYYGSKMKITVQLVNISVSFDTGIQIMHSDLWPTGRAFCWVVAFSHSIFLDFQITDIERIYLFKESYLYKDIAAKYSWHFNLQSANYFIPPSMLIQNHTSPNCRGGKWKKEVSLLIFNSVVN